MDMKIKNLLCFTVATMMAVTPVYASNDTGYKAVQIGNTIEAEEDPIILNEEYKRTTASKLNVRSTPEGEIIAELPYWTEVIVLGEYDGWSAIRYEGETAYVNSKYLTDADTDFVPNDQIPLAPELQHLLWTECQTRGIDYAFALAVMKKESEFTAGAVNHNNNGSTDKGIMQTNSCRWSELKKLGMITHSDDLKDPVTGIKCGMWELNLYTDLYGVSERAYAAYNTGSSKIKSNRNSRTVVKYWNYFKELLA